ncbi:MAG: HlyD family efflux transporter periplasmic adaptor subunit [Anaerolineaceae bacterium]|nr:HlyD family efflux transporter periplasmic adaptor subunit [Anaerolineaceae bacterium]
MKRTYLYFALLTIAMLTLAGCGANTAQPAAAPSSTQADTLIAEGRLLPANFLEHSFSIPGQVAEVLVKDGELVKAGQVLARLNNSPEAELALARAQQEELAAQQALDTLKANAKLELAQAELSLMDIEKEFDTAENRYDANETDENKYKLDIAEANLKLAQDELAKLKAGNPDPIASAQARLASAKAAVVSARAALDALELTATIDGTVVDVTLQAGERVPAGQPVMTVADFSSWVVKTDDLTEVEVVDVKLGEKVEIRLDALPEVKLNGEVTQINKRFEEKRGDTTYTVTAVLNQTDARMRWGMTAAVQLVP